jgi:hypothetical protein
MTLSRLIVRFRAWLDGARMAFLLTAHIGRYLCRNMTPFHIFWLMVIYSRDCCDIFLLVPHTSMCR